MPVTDFPIAGIEVNRPVHPEVIERVELELYGQVYPEPIKVEDDWKPACWPKE